MSRRSVRLFFAIALVLPMAVGQGAPARAQASEPPVLLGIYPTLDLQQSVGDLVAVDAWVDDPAKRLSLAGTFMDIEDPFIDWDVPHELDAAWSLGYTPFVNLTVAGGHSPARTAAYIAGGGIDGAIQGWAQEFAAWSNGGAKQAFIAPLQEMNLDNVVYGMDPDNYIAAFLRIQQIFSDEGVDDSAVSWVFAPNGWSAPGDPGFEAYYPGRSAVDGIGFSAYNFGDCAVWQSWDGPAVAFGPYLARMRAMAPDKPIFIAQTASASAGGDKQQWLVDAYTYLAAYPGVRGILYFNRDKECDWAFYQSAGRQLDGYKIGIGGSDFGYQHPIPLAFDPPPDYTFDDVWRAHPFAGVPDHPDWPYAEALYQNGYTAGCSADPLLYCPQATMNRAESAVFVERGWRGAGHVPSAPAAPVFTDVLLSDWFSGWVDDLWEDGFTAGCIASPLQYCPLQGHSRAEGAVFYVRMQEGPSYVPPVATSQVFADVPLGLWYVNWVNDAYARGLLEPCQTSPSLLYCPTDPLTRGMAARMMVRAKGLPLP